MFLLRLAWLARGPELMGRSTFDASLGRIQHRPPSANREREFNSLCGLADIRLSNLMAVEAVWADTVHASFGEFPDRRLRYRSLPLHVLNDGNFVL